MFIHGHLMGPGVKAAEDQDLLCPCRAQLCSHHPICGGCHLILGLQPPEPPGEVPKQELCPSPAPGWPGSLVPAWMCCRGSIERRGGRGRAEQLLASSQSLGPAGEEGIKLHLFPLFKGKEQRHLTQVPALVEHIALLCAFLPFAMPSCPSLSPLPFSGRDLPWELGPLH